MPRITKAFRWRAAAAVAVVGALALSGCASDTPTTEPEQTLQPVIGGDLTVGLQVAPKSLDPLFGNAPDLDRNTFNLFYEPLIRLLPGGEVENVLAESYETSEDETTLTFTLREGVVFSDGTPFDADAVVANLERVIDPAVASPRASDLVAMDSVTAIDEKTVEITLKSPAPAFLAGLSSEAGLMVSPAALADPAALQLNPVGTGPFVFTGFVNGQDIAAERNPDYWAKDEAGNALPYLDSVTLRIIPDANVKLTELKTGGVQLIDTVPVRQVTDLTSDPAFQVIDGRGVQKWMAFNTTRAPFDDARVRQALALAIDREAISSVITTGIGQVNATLCTPTEVCFDESLKPIATDVDAAKALLEDAGVSDLAVTISVINREPDNTIAQLVQAQLGEIGVTLDIQTLEREAWIEQVLGKDYDMATLQIGVPRLDPSLAFNGSFSATAAQNWAGVDDQDLFDAVATAGSTFDADERREAFATAQKILLDEAYYVFFYWNADPAGATSALQGLTGDQSGAWLMRSTFLSE